MLSTRALLVVAVLSALAFASVTALFLHGGGLGLDSRTGPAIAELVDPSVSPIVRAFDWLGSARAAIAASALAVVVLLLGGRTGAAVFVVAAVAGADEFASLVSRLVEEASYPSLPSTRSEALAVALVIVLWPSAWRRPSVAVGVAVTLAIGFSRLYLGDDSASDVLAGWSLAVAWVAALALAAGRRHAAAVDTGHARLLEPDLLLSFESLGARLRARLQRGPGTSDEPHLDAFLVAGGMNQILEDDLERDVLWLRRIASHLPSPARTPTLAAARVAARLRDAGPAQRHLVRRQQALEALVGALADPVAGLPAHAPSGDAALAELDRVPGGLRRSVQRLPNCFRGFDQRPEDCAELVGRFAARWPDRARPLLVVGLRTSGSYLAPLHASLLRARGYHDVSTITLRPGVPFGRRAAAGLRAAAAAGGLALLVDDPPRTGSQFADAAAVVRRHGVDDVVLMLQLAEGEESLPEALRSHPSVVLRGDEWAIRRAFEPAALERSLAVVMRARQVTVDSVDVLPPRRGHAVAHIRARVDGAERDVHAEGVGAGYFGRHALAVADRLADQLPRVYGVHEGLLFREWMPEQRRVTPERLAADPETVAGAVARYVATRHRRLPVKADVGSRIRGREAVWEHAGHLLADPFGSARTFARPLTEPAARRLVRVAQPSITDARTLPWEWFQDGASGLRKAAYQQRATSNRGLVSYDPVFDLAEAAAGAEAVGQLGAAEELLHAYEAETGTEVEPERWLVYRLLHHQLAYREALRQASNGAHGEYAHALELERVMARTARRHVAGRPEPPLHGGPLCAIDIDGVLESRWVAFPALAPAGADALRTLRAHQRRAVLVTGRALGEVRDRCADYGLAGAAAEYGSVVWDALEGKAVSLLDAWDEAALQIARDVLEQTPGVFLDPAHGHSIRAHVARGERSRRGLDRETIARVLGETGGRVRVAQGALQTDFVAAGIDKARGLRALATRLGALSGAEADVAFAIGDTAEDLPMLALARSPWAPRDASRALRGHARFARQPSQAGVLSAVRAEVGHPHGDCERCRAPRPATSRAALLHAPLTALGGGRALKARQALVLAGRLARPL